MIGKVSAADVNTVMVIVPVMSIDSECGLRDRPNVS
jgi:hypothetical protein